MCSGGRGRGGLSGTRVFIKQDSRCVLEGGGGQAELSQCKAVESSFSEQVLMLSGGQVGARYTGQVCLDKVGHPGQVMPVIPRQARPVQCIQSEPVVPSPEGEVRSVRAG